MSRNRVVPSVVMSLNAAASRAVDAMGLSSGPAAFESLEQRVMMAGQPTASDSSMAYDSVGNLHVAYYDAAAKNLKYTRETVAGAWSAAVTVDSSSSDVGKMVSLAVDNANHVGVAYFDAANGDLRYAFNDGSKWTTVAVDSKGSVGMNPSLAFDKNGVAMISYYKETGGDLRLATLKSLAKNKWSITTIAKKGDVGQNSSLAIDPVTNKPVVAFTDSTGNISVASKKGGSSFSKPVVIDNLDTAGSSLDIGFGANGRPTVSYLDSTTGDIKLAQAGDPKAKFFSTQTIATVDPGSNANPTLLIDPVTHAPQVVFFDTANNGVFVATAATNGSTNIDTKQLKAGGGDGFIAAIQPGNNSISFAVVDTSGTNQNAAPVDLGNTQTTPLPPTDVAASANSASSVTLGWTDNSTNETGFLVERSQDGTTFTQIAQLDPSAQTYTDSGLTEATTYYYRISATGGAGVVSVGSSLSASGSNVVVFAGVNQVVTVTTFPNAPTDLAVDGVSAGEIDLVWSNHSAFATGYEVQRSATGTAVWSVVDTLGGNATTYTDTTVAEGTSYTYRVQALFGAVRSVLSNSASVATKPATPTGLTATQVSPTRLDIAWTNNSQHVTQYVLERSTNGTTFSAVATINAGSATAYSDTSLTEGTAYYYRVKAVGLRDSAYSSVANSTTNPNAPSSLTATAMSPSRIDLSWSDNTSNETGYLVQRSVDGTNFLTVATLDPNTTSFQDSGRTEGVVYSYRVQAVVGQSAQSALSAVVSTTTLPSAPTTLATVRTGGGYQAALTWNDNATGESGYRVQRQVAGSNTWVDVTTTSPNTSGFIDTSAAEGKTYTYRVNAVNSAGASAFSNSSTVTILPAAPTGLVVAAGTPNALDLQWTDNSTGETGYVIERSANGVDFTQLDTVDAGVNFYQDAGLDPAATWHYRVSATNDGGNSAATTIVHQTTLTDAPTSLNALSISATEIDLTWSDVTGATGYSIERLNGDAWVEIDQVSGTSYQAVTEEGASYAYRVRAIDAGGKSLPSPTATAVSRPAAPTSLNASSPTATSVSLSWTDNSLGETQYAIERADNGGDFAPLTTVGENITLYTDTTVSESSSYAYRIHALNDGGVSGDSNTASVATRPAAAVNVVAVAVSDDTVTLTWDDASSGSPSFRVERSLAGNTLSFSSVGVVDAGTTTLTDSIGLTAGMTYVYRVVAINEAGESISDNATISTRTAAVTNFAATPASDTSMDLSWTVPAGATGFIITRSENGTDFDPVTTLTTADDAYTDHTVTEAKTYTYRIIATNDGGPSVSADTTGTTLPAMPDIVGATAVDATHVNLSWTDNSAGEDGYSVEISTDGGDSFHEVTTVDASTEELDGIVVEEGTSPMFRVRATLGDLRSAYSDITSADTVPAAPSDVSVESLAADALGISWTNNSNHATGFRIERSVNGGGFVEVGTVDGETTAFADTGLAESTTYTYQVRATMASTRNSAYSATAVGTTRPSAPDQATAGLISGGIEVVWHNTSTGANSYVIERSVNGGDFGIVSEQPGTTFDDSDVQPGTTYDYRIRAVGDAGESANSVVAEATTIPSSPTGVDAETLPAITGVSITWTDVAGETGYNIYRKSGIGSYTLIGTTDPNATSYEDDAVAENTAYDYVVTAFNDSGESDDSSMVSVHTGLIAPTGLDVLATPSSVSLSWVDNSNGEAEYTIERSDDQGDHWSTIDTVNADEVSYVDSSVAEGTMYMYRVSATNGSTVSATSEERTIVTPLSAPTGLTAAAASDSEIDLSWTNAATGQTGFQIFRSTDGLDDFHQIDFVGANATSYTDTDVTEGTQYHYEVRAANDIAESDGATADVTTLSTGISGLAVSGMTSGTISLSWTNNSTTATGLRVERSDENGSFNEVDTIDADQTSLTDQATIEGTHYRYRVVVIGPGGELPSAPLSVTPPPAAPSVLQTSSSSTSSIHLAWSDNSHQEDGFQIERSTDANEGFAAIDTVGADVNTYDDATAVTGTQYFYRVEAQEDALTSDASNVADGITIPAAPTISAATGVSDTEVGLTWTASAGATGYTIERKLGAGSFAVIHTVTDGTTTSWADQVGMAESSDYTYRILASNLSGDGPYSSTAAARTLPAAAVSLSINGTPQHDRIDLAWGVASAASIHVYRSDNDGPFVDIVTRPPSSTSFSDTSVTGGNTYTYKLILNDGVNDSLPSNTATATTPPEAVDNLNAVANSDTEVAITWSDSFSATSYKVSRSEDGLHFTELDTVETNSYTDDTAVEGTQYYYEVEPIGPGGTGQASVYVLTTLPAAVTNVNVDSYTDTSVTLSWDDNDHSETGFTIERDRGNGWEFVTTTNPDETSFTDSTALEATTYVYRVTPVINAKQGGSAGADVTTLPTAASGVTATCLTSTSVNVTWQDNSDGEFAYRVLRSDDSGVSFQQVGDDLEPDTQSFEDDTVSPARSYIYKVVAQGFGGDSADSNTDTVLTVTDAVTDLAATATGVTQVDLTWSDVVGNDSYRLERQTAGNSSWDLVDDQITANATSYSDTTAAEGTTYTYRIFAVNATGDSAVSNTQTVTTVPATPSALDAAPTTATNIHVIWTDNSSGETGVELQRYDGVSWTTLDNLDPNTVSYDDTVAPGSTYSYRVRMSNDGGESNFSNVDSATTVPAQVGTVAASADSDASVTITWASVSGATGYRVMRSDNAGSSYSQVGSDLAANAVSYTDATVDEATPYLYQIVAFNTTGAGAASTAQAVTTFAAAPTALSVTAITTTQVQLGWTDNSGGEAHYHVFRAEGSGEFAQVAEVAPNTLSWNDTDISPATTYSYYVTASNDAGESDPTSTVTALTRSAAPALSAATPTSDTTATITWSAVTGATAGYKLYRDDGNGYTLVASPAAGATSYSDSGLTEASTYSYKLTAVNATGASADSNVLSALTMPAAPDTVVVGTVTDTTVDLSWTDNSNGEDGFVIFRSADNGDSWDVAGTSNANDATFTDTNLTAGTRYLYHVTATDLSGSSDATLDTAALTLPAAPTGLDAQPTSDTAIHITWDAQPGIFNHYSLLRDDGNGFAEIAQPASSDTSYDDSSLTEGTSYAYKLVAVNNSGNSAASTQAVAATNPAAPTAVGSTSLATNGLTVTWTDNSAAEDGFEVQTSDNGTDWSDAGLSPDISSTGGTGSVPETRLTEATHYYYRVRATMGGQTSAWSSSYQVDTLPNTPTALTVTSFTDTSVSLEWEDRSDGEDGYVVQCDSGSGFVDVTTLGAGVTSYTDSSLTESSDLVYRVHAYKGTSASADSVTAAVTTRPTAPTNLVTSATDPTTVDLTWDDNSGTEDGFIIERNDGNGWTQIDTAAADAESYTDSSAPESATMTYRVSAYTAQVQSALTDEVEVTTPVAVPTAAVASATSDTTVQVTWSINSNVQTAQRLERSDDSGGSWHSIADLDDSATQYDDSGLTENHGYEYRVVALVNAAESTPSTAATVTTPLSAPTALAATSPTATSVQLTWTNHSTAATNIVIERNANGGGWSTLTTISSALATYTDSTVSEGLPYQYRIHATKAGNASATTAAASLTTIPAAPTSLSVTAFSETEIDLTWTDNSSHENGYEILRSENGGAYSSIASIGADQQSYNDTGVHEGGTFAYLVQAVGTGGNSAQASGSAITTPAAPTGFTVSQSTATQLNLSWTDNSNGETGYTIERSTDGGTNYSALTTVGAGVTTYSDTVSEASTYYYRVRADRSTAHSAWVVNHNTTVPATPSGLASSVPAGSPRVVLTWTDNSAGETGYDIERSTDNATWSSVTTTAANAATYSDNSVVEGTTYYYRVRAASTAGASLWSNTTTASTLPSTPTGLAATAITGNRVDLTWTDVSTKEAGYKVERLPSGGSWTVIATIAANSASYSDTTTAEGVQYSYRVRAYTTAAQGSPSTSVNVTTPLNAPSNLSATAVSTSQVNLTWTDNSSAETGYKIERSANAGSTWTTLTTATANSTSYSDSTASAGTTYIYQVKATKGAASSAYATSSSVTTVPTAPSSASASAASNTQVTVTWVDASGESNYTIERSTNGGSTWTVITTNIAANTTTYTDTGLTENSAYLYRVKATNAAGASTYSTTSSVTTLPTGPSSLLATTVASDTVQLAWTDNSAAETSFEIQREVSGSNSWSTIAIVSANTASYVDPTLAESTSYDYRVRASVGGRNSAFSNTSQASTLPAAPDSLAVASTDESSVSLMWNNTTDAPTIVIERSDDGGDNFTAIDTVAQGGTSYTDTGRTEGTTYVYRVRAYNGDGGFSDYTNTAVGVTLAAAATALSADASSGTEVVLHWTDNSNGEQSYVVQRSAHGANSWGDLDTLDSDSNSYTDANVTTGDDWDYRVGVTNDGGTNYSSIIRAQV